MDVTAETRVGITDGIRTPFVKSFGKLASSDSLDLAAHTISRLREHARLEPHQVDQVIFGSVIPNRRAPNFAHQAVVASDLDQKHTSTLSVSDYCITALVAMQKLMQSIQLHEAEIGIAGGSESMSNPQLLFSPQATKFFLSLNQTSGIIEQARTWLNYRPTFAFPPLPELTEPTTGLTMLEHAELTAHAFQISRESQDRYALKSHAKAYRAQQIGALAPHIAPIRDVTVDDIPNVKRTAEMYAARKTVSKITAEPTITAYNATGLSDGAAALCLMSEKAALSLKKPILAYIQGIEVAQVNPAEDGLLQAPGVAVPRLLKRLGLTFNDIDLFEIHEAFSAQTLCNLKSWEQGWAQYGIEPLGKIPAEKINIYGGSLALGHPLSATGARLGLIAYELHRRLEATGKPQTALLSACAAGGRGAAMILRSEKI